MGIDLTLVAFFFNKIGLTFRPPLFPRFAFFKMEIYRPRFLSYPRWFLDRDEIQEKIRGLKYKSEIGELQIKNSNVSNL